MRIRLHNVGPIRDADVAFAPLTVLIGPNGSGKTTLSSAMYAASLAHGEAWRSLGQIGYRRSLRALRTRAEFAHEVAVLTTTWEDVFRDAFELHLRRCLADDLTRLGREGRGGKGAAPRIDVSNAVSADAGWNLVFRIHGDALVLERSNRRYRPPAVPRERPRPWSDSWYDRRVRRVLTGGMPARALYFPAARSGVMTMRSALTSLMLSALSAGRFRHATVGEIPGTTEDFLQFLSTLDPSADSTVGAEALDTLQRAVLHGAVRLRTAAGAPHVEFRPAGLSQPVPIEAAATSAAELAPLALYLKHEARYGHAVFIDEPEAHFHPRSQVALARALTQMSRAVGRVVVASHSEFLLNGLSNVLMEEHARGRTSTGLMLRKPLGVAFYDFRPGPRPRDGVCAQRLPFNPADGLDVEQFSSVADETIDHAVELYNEIHAPDAR